MKHKIADNRVHFGPDHTTVPNLKTYLKDTEKQSLTSIRYLDGRAASKRLATLFGEKVFTNPKDELLLRDIYRAVGVCGDDVVLDLFAGSASACQAVLELNLLAGSQCRYIGIQVAEDLNESLKTAKGAARQITTNAIRLFGELEKPATVAEIGKHRLRLAGAQLREKAAMLDVGFRSLRVDTTNMSDVLRTPDSIGQAELELYTDSIKSDRSGEDLLIQVLLDWGLELTMPIQCESVDAQEIFVVEDDALVACFAESVSSKVTSAIAERRPLRAVFRDSGFATDADRINAEQIFAERSPATEVKTI